MKKFIAHFLFNFFGLLIIRWVLSLFISDITFTIENLPITPVFALVVAIMNILFIVLWNREK